MKSDNVASEPSRRLTLFKSDHPTLFLNEYGRPADIPPAGLNPIREIAGSIGEIPACISRALAASQFFHLALPAKRLDRFNENIFLKKV